MNDSAIHVSRHAKKSKTSWGGYVVYDATSNQVLAVYGAALMVEAFDQRDNIAALDPLAHIMAEWLDCPSRPHVGTTLRFK